MSRHVCNNAALLDNAWHNHSGFWWGKYLREGSISPLGNAISEILEVSFQALIYHPSVPRAHHVIALHWCLDIWVYFTQTVHVLHYYPSSGHRTSIFQEHVLNLMLFSISPVLEESFLYNIEGAHCISK